MDHPSKFLFPTYLLHLKTELLHLFFLDQDVSKIITLPLSIQAMNQLVEVQEITDNNQWDENRNGWFQSSSYLPYEDPPLASFWNRKWLKLK